MTTCKQAPYPFTPEKPMSLRAIDQSWVKAQMEEHSIVASAALEVAIEMIFEKMGNNIDNLGELLVMAPDNDKDPYIIGIPYDSRKEHLKHPQYLANNTNQNSNLPNPLEGVRKDFEELMKVRYPKIKDENFSVNDGGDYTDIDLNNHWKGFLLYHQGLTIASTSSDHMREHKTLGKYITLKVGPQGAIVTMKYVKRHDTKEEAITAAIDFSVEQEAPFAILRCLDIVDAKVRG